ncbi:MAG: helix-turn-helix transcriptional regulator, partial [Elusimicrobiota bacterium]
MNTAADRALGRLLRERREALLLSQVDLSRRMRWPQAKVSRVERGKRSVTLPELLDFSHVFQCSVDELLGGLQSRAESATKTDALPDPVASALTPGFCAAYGSEEALLAQLARYGVKFLGEGGRPAFLALPLDEVLLAALRFSHDPRVFEALPALLLAHAERVDWAKLVSAAYALRLQNRLGMVVAAALELKGFAAAIDQMTWKTLQEAHDALAEAKLDREEAIGPLPKTEAALAFLRRRTPRWLRFWHGLGAADLESF